MSEKINKTPYVHALSYSSDQLKKKRTVYSTPLNTLNLKPEYTPTA